MGNFVQKQPEYGKNPDFSCYFLFSFLETTWISEGLDWKKKLQKIPESEKILDWKNFRIFSEMDYLSDLKLTIFVQDTTQYMSRNWAERSYKDLIPCIFELNK